MKPPYIKLFVKDFAFDVQNLTDQELGKYMRLFINAYRTGVIHKNKSKDSLFKELKTSLTSYQSVCERNRNNRTKSYSYDDQSSTSGQPVVDQLVKPITRTNNQEPYTPLPPVNGGVVLFNGKTKDGGSSGRKSRRRQEKSFASEGERLKQMYLDRARDAGELG